VLKIELVSLLVDDFFSEEKVSNAQNAILEAPCSVEVKKAVFDSYSDGAPGSDGLSFVFYQKFWDLLKNYIMDLFADFSKGS
jgi:hypothetical protein